MRAACVCVYIHIIYIYIDVFPLCTNLVVRVFVLLFAAQFMLAQRQCERAKLGVSVRVLY